MESINRLYTVGQNLELIHDSSNLASNVHGQIMKNVSQLFFGSNENLITKYKRVQFYRFLRMLSDVNEEF